MVLKTVPLNDVIFAVISYKTDEIFRLKLWASQLVDLTKAKRKQ